ncbi:MAG: hypothetical protein QW673_01875 [Candidatus Thermoplasmatota archaeon]
MQAELNEKLNSMTKGEVVSKILK